VYSVVNVASLAFGEKDGVVNLASLIESGVVKKNSGLLKVLGNGELKAALTVQAHAFSASAKEKIQNAGGQAETLPAAAEKPKA
jgi:large subunit ribosomal protein L15